MRVLVKVINECCVFEEKEQINRSIVLLEAKKGRGLKSNKIIR